MEAVKVFLSGASDSGKTVYLASLFNSLANPDALIGLRCETTTAARNILSPAYNRLGSGWPPPTALWAQEELPFSFFIKPKGQLSQLAQMITFYDYSGEAIVAKHDDGFARTRAEQIEALVAQCDVIICVLDGRLVHDAVYTNAGKPTVPLLDAISAAHSFWTKSELEEKHRHNYYFMVTKWDLFDDNDDEVSKIRSLLTNIPIIRGYLQSIDADSVVKIIPVSAVGKGFARWNPNSGSTGEMEIIGSMPGDPINIQIPIASVVPELIKAELRREMRKLNSQAQTIQDEHIPWWRKILSSAGDVIGGSQTLRDFITEIGVHPTDIDKIAQQLRGPLIRTQADRDRRMAELAAAVRSQKDAAAVAQNQFAMLTDNFDAKYPSADLRPRS